MPSNTPPQQPAPGSEPTTHELKVWPSFFAALLDGTKTFEFRKDDREPRFAVGDVLHLREWCPPSLGDDEHGCLAHFAAEYTGRECHRRVIYVARDPEGEIIPSGFCVMSLEPLAARSGSVREETSDVDLPPVLTENMRREYVDALRYAIDTLLGISAGETNGIRTLRWIRSHFAMLAPAPSRWMQLGGEPPVTRKHDPASSAGASPEVPSETPSPKDLVTTSYVEGYIQGTAHAAVAGSISPIAKAKELAELFWRVIESKHFARLHSGSRGDTDKGDET